MTTHDDGAPLERVDCAQAIDQLFEFLDSEMDHERGDLIRVHLASCESCFAEYDVVDHIKALVKRSCGERAPEELHVRIRTQLTVLRAELG
ncbi:MAG: mycothiol system anti-sigma-R factor [Actinomycetota bacterium]|nr:mycothiol system anti-sigma-R factor [Actinomycetota bacterium]